MHARRVWRGLLLMSVVAASASACSSEEAAPAQPDPVPKVGCLDRPNELPRPPEGSLPCDLLPPGFEP